MDIVFQSGEFVNSDEGNKFWDVLIAIVGAAIGTYGAIWVYKRQTQDAKEKVESERKEQQLQKVAFLKNSVSDSKSQIESQISCYEEFVSNISENDYFIPSLMEPPLKDLDLLINKINREDFFHSYLNEFKPQALEVTILIEEFRKMFLCFYAFEDNFKKIQKLYLECNRNNVTSTQAFPELKSAIKKSVTDAARVNGNLTRSPLFIETLKNGFAKVLLHSDDEDYYNKLTIFLSEIAPFMFEFGEAANLYHTIENTLNVFESKNNNVRRIRNYVSNFIPKSKDLLGDLNSASGRLLAS